MGLILILFFESGHFTTFKKVIKSESQQPIRRNGIFFGYTTFLS